MQKIETVVYSLPKVNDKLEESIYAQKLLKEVRFGQFRTRRFSKEKWVRLLGVDTNNFLHMRLMRGLTHQFLKNNGDQNSDNTFLLELIATIHDLQEYYHGDTPAPLKKHEDDLAEMDTLEKMIRELFAGSKLIELIPKIREIFTSQETDLGKMWRCIEQIGYMRTALIAYRRLQPLQEITYHSSERRQKTLKRQLRAMITNVFKNQMQNILSSAHEYPAVRYFLDEWAPILDHLFASTFIKDIHHDFLTEGKGEVSEENQKILEQMSEIKVMWETYRKEHPTPKKVPEMVK